MTISEILLYCFGFLLSGAIITAPIAYALGRYDERRASRPLWNHVRELHRSLNHKSFVVLSPRVGANRAIPNRQAVATTNSLIIKGRLERIHQRRKNRGQ